MLAGEPTLSVSCSDKLAKWGLLGWQGALLGSLLAAPLAPASITILQQATEGTGQLSKAAQAAALQALHRALRGASLVHAAPA